MATPKVSNKISFGAIDTAVETRLSFQPDQDQLNGICIGTLESIELKEHDVPLVKEDGTPNTGEFKGLKMVSIVATFKQINFSATDTAARYITLAENITGTKLTTGESMDMNSWSSLVTAQFARLQHLTNAFDKGNCLPLSTNISAIDLTFEDEPAARIIKMKKVYEHFIKQITGDATKPRFKDVQLFMVVAAEYKKGEYYAIPSFVKKGLFEVVQVGKKPTIEIPSDLTIILSKKEKKGAGSQTKSDMTYQDSDAKAPQVGNMTAQQILDSIN